MAISGSSGLLNLSSVCEGKCWDKWKNKVVGRNMKYVIKIRLQGKKYFHGSRRLQSICYQ